jgi:hypothetical protein
MSQELVTQNEGGFDVAERSSSFIIGGMIKYHNHAYTLNKTEPLLLGTILMVIRIVTCWVKWWNNLPVEHRVTHSGQLHPRKEDMPDRDESLWQIGIDGKKADPWKDTRYVYIIDPKTGADFTFITDSSGGRQAVGELKSAIRNVHRVRPGAIAVIKLGTGTFKSPKFGLVPRPVFEILEYRGGEMQEAPAQLSKPTVESPSLAQEMNDEIPTYVEADPPKAKAATIKAKKK